MTQNILLIIIIFCLCSIFVLTNINNIKQKEKENNIYLEINEIKRWMADAEIRIVEEIKNKKK